MFLVDPESSSKVGNPFWTVKIKTQMTTQMATPHDNPAYNHIRGQCQMTMKGDNQEDN
jgi:hypothetical protein